MKVPLSETVKSALMDPKALQDFTASAISQDSAQSELAASREELARVKGISDNYYSLLVDANQSLTAAEQRNATLTTLLREGLEEYKNGNDWIDRVIEALRNQPTETGASPKLCIECGQPYCLGVCVERGDEPMHKFNESGASE
ncbi:hypothetical protein [Pseudomonas sp.]|uniref:hypothetical protein n=1 Tax=Pseudomonas sp. TaxID=306 RepID=UPI0032659F91